MQEKSPTPNQDRSDKTRAALKAAMRDLVLDNGYAAAGTPAIVKKAGVTRGALYHHFSDKRELFSAVVEEDCKAVADEITARSSGKRGTLTALKSGADAFISAMAENGRTRIILIEAPSVLGREEIASIENRYSRGLLREGLAAAIDAGVMEKLPIAPLNELLSAMFDSASLNIENGMPENEVLAVVHRIINGLKRQSGKP